MFDFNRYIEQQKIEDLALQEEDRKLFFQRLEVEIVSFQALADLCLKRYGPLTQPMEDALLLPAQQDLEKVMRYEAALERQFERKLQQLVSWRREKRESGEQEPFQDPEDGQSVELQ